MSKRAASYLALALLALMAMQPLQAQDPRPPTAPVRVVKDNYFGTVVEDPYRWMEQPDSQELAAWMKAQNAYTRQVLARIPGRDKLIERIKQLDNAGIVLYGIQYDGGRYFYYKQMPGDTNFKLYVRDGLQGKERLLVDPEKLAKGSQHFSIDYFNPSVDGRYVAYGISPGGSENSVIRIVDATTGRLLPDAIDRAEYGGISWLPDNRSFYYNRLRKMQPGMPQVEKYRKSMIYLHHLGGNPDREPPLFGYGLSPAVPFDVDDSPYISVVPLSRWAFGQVQHGVKNEMTLYVAPLDAIRGSATPWRKIADVDDAVTRFDAHGDDLYLLTHKDASRYKIVHLRLPSVDLAHADVAVPAGEKVIISFQVAQDALYVQDLDGGIGRLRRMPWGGQQMQPIPLPFDGAVGEMACDYHLPGTLLRLTGWTHSSQWYAFDPRSGLLTNTGIRPPNPVDFSQIEALEVKAKSADSTMVPLSIMARQGLARDGSHPTLLDGYGSYGVTMDPSFDPTRMAWLEQGGVLAFAHVRGGGEYGEDWHLAGQKLTKQHTIDDFIACGQYLVDQKYTSPAHLSGSGTSAGGITIGGAVTQRPDLFGAAISGVGVSNALRDEFTPNGPPNIPEFGSVKTPDGFKALYAMDAYSHVKDGTAYPAVLLTTGINDPRVASWEPAKMAARLQAATSSGKPILLRVDYDAGHGIGSTRVQRDLQTADEDAFLLWQLGVPAFQPPQ